MTYSTPGTRLKHMEAKKDVLILTDGLEGAAKMAAEIAAALEGSNVSVKTVSEFKGNDILPAEAFFLGCETPEPDSFAYLGDLLKHINLAGRPCGVFSPGSEDAAKYLAGLVKDCEAALSPAQLAGSGAEIGSWANSVVSQAMRG